MLRSKYVRIAIPLLVCMCIAVLLFSPQGNKKSDDLLVNGNFVSVDEEGMPNEWFTTQWFYEDDITLYSVEKTDGYTAAHIKNASENDARFCQSVNVEPDTVYLLHGYIKAECEGGRGANLSIEGVYSFSEGVFSTADQWREISFYGKTGANQKSVVVYVRLGGYSGESVGEAWFRDISLTKAESVPEGSEVHNWYAGSDTNTEGKEITEDLALSGALKMIFYIVLYLIAADLFFVWYKKQQNDSQSKLNDAMPRVKDPKKIVPIILALLFGLVFVGLRFYIADRVFGYDVDIGCFTAWTDIVREYGTNEFYTKAGFCDYPPAYILLLRGVALFGEATSFTVKLPAIAADLFIAGMVYYACMRRKDKKLAAILALLYLMNPVSILTGAAWGQCDSVLTAALLLSVLLLLERRWYAALPVYTLSVLLKPQALMFGPLGVVALVMDIVFVSRANKQKNVSENTAKYPGTMKKTVISALIGTVVSAVLIVGIWALFTDFDALKRGKIEDRAEAFLQDVDTKDNAFVFDGRVYDFSAVDANAKLILYRGGSAAITGQSEDIIFAQGSWDYVANDDRSTQEPDESTPGLIVDIPGIQVVYEKNDVYTVCWEGESGETACFTYRNGIRWSWLLEMYVKTMTQYGYATVNSCNAYFLVGENWMGNDQKLNALVPVLCIILYALPLLAAALLKREKRNRWILFAFVAVCTVLMLQSFFRALSGTISYSSFGTMAIALAVITGAGMLVLSGNLKHLPLAASVMMVLLYSTSTMMHERYLFPVIALLLLACVIEKDKRVLWLLLAVTVFSFLNIACVLDRNIRIGGFPGHLNAPQFGVESDLRAVEYVAAVVACITAGFALWLGADKMVLGNSTEDLGGVFEKAEKKSRAAEALLNSKTEKTSRMFKADWLIVCAITAVYAVVSLVNLGSMKAPESEYRYSTGDEAIVFDLGEKHSFYVLYYSGIQWGETWYGTKNAFDLAAGEDGVYWSRSVRCESSDGDCFTWKYAGYKNEFTGRYLKLNVQSSWQLNLKEIICRDVTTGEVIPLKVLSGPEGAVNLCDEQDTLEGEPGWWNSCYFDEIYHARTAYEHLHGLTTYETSHPPLGKVIMSLGIAIFGMCPFGWRVMGALCGVLMLPAVYMLARLIIKKRKYAIGAIALFACDLMHFTQTRIATIDSYVVLFILWSIYCMWYWMRQDYFNAKYWRTMIPLMLSGMFMGLSIASKWTGCYNGVGLAVMFFGTVILRFMQCRKAKTLLSDEATLQTLSAEKTTSLESIKKHGNTKLLISVASCIVFFIAVPLAIYYASYIPYFKYDGGVTVEKVIRAAVGDYFKTGVLDASCGMLGYHSTPGLGMDHPFYSPWYEWPFVLKPMWYYSDSYAQAGTASTIMSMGNPAVWWTGFAGVICAVGMCYVYVRSRALRIRQTGADYTIQGHGVQWLLVALLAQYLPWMLVPRGTYIYHYFACVPITVLCLMAVLSAAEECACIRRSAITEGAKDEKKINIFFRVIVALLIASALFLFIAFFPYASGVTVSREWLEKMRWFTNWLWY